MADQARKSYEIDLAIEASAGMAFVNRKYSRSFSINIFRANAAELIEALRHLSDPDHGLRMMSHDNREAGRQAHREVNRRIHNFVAAAKTLVDHTRVFMKDHYERTSMLKIYEEEAKRRFEKNPIAKFTHDLRNYMLHRGLPNSTMFIHYSQDPEQPNLTAKITTGVQLDAEKLRSWDRWTAPARAYLDTVGGELPIEDVVSSYASEVEEFQTWIDDQLVNFHAADIAELDALREEYALSKSEIEVPHETKSLEKSPVSDLEGGLIDDFLLPPATAIEIAQMGAELLAGIRKLDFAAMGEEQFKSDRPVGVRITPEELIGQPIIAGEDRDGNPVLAFILKESEVYGFDHKSIELLQNATNLFLEVSWAQQCLNEKFVWDTIIEWCSSSFTSGAAVDLAESIVSISKIEVKPLDVWAPIAHLEIESGFSFGPVDILPMTAEMINRLESDGIKAAPSQEAGVRGLFNSLRSTMQGYASVVIGLKAVTERAKVEGLEIAREAVNLLRFFSPAASVTSLYCPTSLLGNEVVPTSHVLVLGDGSFSYSEGGLPISVAYWRMSNAKLANLREALSATGALIRTEYLDEFERAVRSGMILFGTAATFREPSDRLIYTLSAMEGLLLKHELEAAAYSVEKRMAQLLANDEELPSEVARIVRAIYRLRARHGSLQWSDFDREILQEFVRCAHRVIVLALQNISQFGTRADFIEAIELRNRA